MQQIKHNILLSLALVFINNVSAISIKELVKKNSVEYINQRKKTLKQAPSNNDLVDVLTKIPNIVLDIRYATKNNFTRSIVYPQAKCYLRRNAAQALKKVQTELEKKHLGLKIFDAYRPYSAQQIFWNLCPDPRYVADPAKGSKHNRGSAVDLTLVDLKTKKELEMPSAFDDFTEKAHRTYNTMSPTAAKNCKLLEDCMVKYGFVPFATEWWHFDFKTWEQFDLLDVPFNKLG
jgi:D-alanyl-D-alanine dipeptidase